MANQSQKENLNMIETQRIECWKVTIDRNVDDEPEDTYFATQELAELAVQWAYEVRLNELTNLNADRLSHEIRKNEVEQYMSCKIVHFVSDPNRPGYGHWEKEYFSYSQEVIERDIVQ